MDDITNEDRVDTALILYDAFLKANYDNVRAASEIFYELKEQRTAYTELEADYQALLSRYENMTTAPEGGYWQWKLIDEEGNVIQEGQSHNTISGN